MLGGAKGAIVWYPGHAQARTAVRQAAGQADLST